MLFYKKKAYKFLNHNIETSKLSEVLCEKLYALKPIHNEKAGVSGAARPSCLEQEESV